MDPAEIVGAFGSRRRGFSPLGATACRYARRLVIAALLMAVVVVVTVYDPGLLSSTVGVSTTVVGVGGPTFLVRLELGALAGVLAVGVSLVALVDRDPAVDLHAASGWLAPAAVGFLVGTAAAWQSAPGLVDVPVKWGRVAVDPRQSTLELELFFPVAVGDGVAVAPLLFELRRASTLSRRLTGRARGLSPLCLVAFVAYFSPSDLTTFVLYAAPPVVGLGVTVV